MTPQEVLNDSVCFACQDDGLFQAQVLALLVANLEALGVTLTPQEVMADSACFACMAGDNFKPMVLALLNAIAEAGGGGATTSFQGYPGVDSLRARTVHVANDVAYLLYVSTPGDAGQGMFQWSTTEAGADDGLSIIRADNNPFPALGAWIRLS